MENRCHTVVVTDHVDDQELDDLIQVVDLDGLVLMVDARCAADDWAGVLRLRDRCAANDRSGTSSPGSTGESGPRIC